MVWDGVNVIQRAKKILGYTDPNTLYWNFPVGKLGKNIAITSKDYDQACAQVRLWFCDREIETW